MNKDAELHFLNEIVKHKEHGYSILNILRQQSRRHMFLFVLVFASVYFYLSGVFPMPFFTLIIGFLVGSVAQQLVFLRKSKEIWPLYEKIIDWTKVDNTRKSANTNLDHISGSR